MPSVYIRATSRSLSILLLCLLLALSVPIATAATTELHIRKIAADGVSVIDEKTVDYRWLESNLPVQGDGMTHYYHQGPVFEGDPWNLEEDTNVLEKDMGAVKGTDLRDICELVGGMGEEDTVRVKASDGMSKTFPYRNVYEPEPRQGPMVVTWYRAEDGYVPDYYTGMRLVFFADTSTNPQGVHAFGVWDMHECFDPEYWYFFQPNLPTTTGLSVQHVSEIVIYSEEDATGSIHINSTPVGATVFIDGDKADSVTPCTITDVEVGTHSVQVELKGFVQPDEEWIVVNANDVTNIEFALDPEVGSSGGGSDGSSGSWNGSIAITSVPMNASIYLDGNLTGFWTDTVLEDVPPGEHTVKLELPDYPSVTRTVAVGVGECIHLDLIFDDTTADAGAISVSSIPTNVSIYLDGNATGLRTNKTLNDIPAGRHMVDLVMPGYRDATKTVIVEEGKITNLDFILSPIDDETGSNATTHGEPIPEHPAPDNFLEAFIEAVFAFMDNILSSFGLRENSTVKSKPVDTQVTEGDVSAPTGTTVREVQTPVGSQLIKNRSGGLYITSYPPGMAIIIDNKKLVQKTPQIVYGLREGLHTVKVEESDPSGEMDEPSYRFESLQAWVYPDAVTPILFDGLVTQNKKTVRIASEAYQGGKFTANGLFPSSDIPGDAEVESLKSWITVFCNGEYYSHSVPPGISGGKTYTVEPQNKDTVSIAIRSYPEGAAIFVDGFPTGEVTPCRVAGLSPGQHRILVSMPGYFPAEEIIRIPEGARTGGSITCTLQEYAHGNLCIESTVPDAKIYLYGRYTGEKTPHTFPGMSIGTYEIRIVSENATKTVWDVLVTPEETARCMVSLKEEMR